MLEESLDVKSVGGEPQQCFVLVYIRLSASLEGVPKGVLLEGVTKGVLCVMELVSTGEFVCLSHIP